MGDGASSSSSNSSKEREISSKTSSLVEDHGKRRSPCGYCKSTSSTSISHGLWAHSITVDDYQELLDRGWRRSGCFLYKPEMERTCCPSYTIRLKAGDFAPSKEQLRVHKKMQRYLDGKANMSKIGSLKDQQNLPEGSLNLDGDASSATKVSEITTESPAGICEEIHLENEFIDYLSKLINEAVIAYVKSAAFSSTIQLPRAVVKRVTFRAKRKLMEIPEDLLYTSNISFQIAALLRHSSSSRESMSLISSPNPREGSLDISPTLVAEKLAGCIEQNLEDRGLIIKACNGHLNFYSSNKQVSSFVSSSDTSMQSFNENKHSFAAPSGEVPPFKRRRLEIRMKRSSFDPEEFALYRRYQIRVHDDKPDKVTESSYRRFLVDSPLVFVPPHSNHRAVPPCGFGSFHQQYVIDGKLVAVGVVDILPKCLSSKYLFWDPDLAFLSLGKYSALQEINWVKEAEACCPSLQYYYLGYYIHSCSKMRYKAAYHPSELLCPLRYEWVPFKIAKPLLDKTAYAILSDHMTLNSQESSAQLPSMAVARSDSPKEDAKDDLEAFDISNILMDVNGSRFKVKDLEQMFGPVDRGYMNELEMQLRRYVKAVGQELSNNMVYSLG